MTFRAYLTKNYLESSLAPRIEEGLRNYNNIAANSNGGFLLKMTNNSNTFTFIHLADAFIQTDFQERALQSA